MNSKHAPWRIAIVVLAACGVFALGAGKAVASASSSGEDGDAMPPPPPSSRPLAAPVEAADTPPPVSSSDADADGGGDHGAGSAPNGAGVALDPNLPQALTAEHFRDFLERSPFTRALNLSESLMLTGLARVDGKPVATLMDRESKETYVISEVPNPQGWKLVEVSSAAGAGLETVTASISVGGEVVTVRYDERQLKPGEGKTAGGGNSKGKDTRPPPTEAEKKAFGKMVHERWKGLSKEQQERAKKLMGEKMKDPSMSDRQKGEMVVRILDEVSGRGGRSKR